MELVDMTGEELAFVAARFLSPLNHLRLVVGRSGKILRG